MEEVKELVIGTRYWLDSSKDVSGVCVGTETGDIKYTDIEGDLGSYGYSADGTVGFLSIGSVSIVKGC